MNSSYNLPNRHYIASSCLDNEFERTVQRVQTELNDVEFVCLTSDLWTSIQMYSYLGVTVHFLDSDLNFLSRTLGVVNLVGTKSTEVIKDSIISICEDWKISDKLFAINTDNGSNFINLASAIGNSFEPKKIIYSLSCAAHVLNLIMKKLVERYLKEDFHLI